MGRRQASRKQPLSRRWRPRELGRGEADREKGIPVHFEPLLGKLDGRRDQCSPWFGAVGMGRPKAVGLPGHGYRSKCPYGTGLGRFVFPRPGPGHVGRWSLSGEGGGEIDNEPAMLLL